MQHLVAVGADGDHILDRIEFTSLAFKGRESYQMMNVDVTFAYLTVCLCKIKIANPTPCTVRTNAGITIRSAALGFVDENRHPVALFF